MQCNNGKVKVIQCGSWSLFSAEKNYSTLELELTAIVWAVQKCNFFLKGIERFEVVTDHRPLVGIFAKNLNQIDNKRIVRLREKIIDQPFEVKWMAGKETVIADALSCAPAKTTDDSTSLPINACVLAPTLTFAEIVKCARTDVAYKQIINAFKQCRELSNLPENHPARRLKQVWGRISLSDDGVLIVDEDKLYLPPGARKKVLHQLHESHCGYGKTLQTARSLYFWPSMKYDIRNIVDNCEACQQLKPSKTLRKLKGVFFPWTKFPPLGNCSPSGKFLPSLRSGKENALWRTIPLWWKLCPREDNAGRVGQYFPLWKTKSPWICPWKLKFHYLTRYHMDWFSKKETTNSLLPVLHLWAQLLACPAQLEL